MISLSLEKALKNSSYQNELFEVMEYAVFPAGKLFRPRLVEALALDHNHEMTKNHLHLAAAIELHHAYTLVHDDLPAMDNDLTRRGKPSTHAHFGEWKAILAGDALLIASFNELAQINHAHFHQIYKLMTWTTGAKGLILGQFKDLDANNNLSIKDVVRIHELKTARLIQLATLGTYYLTGKNNLREKLDYLRLGKEIGISFQLLDDLSELTEEEVSVHEKSINPFITSNEMAISELASSYQRLSKILKKYELNHLEQMLNVYFKENQKRLTHRYSYLEKNISEINPRLKEWITNFV